MAGGEVGEGGFADGELVQEEASPRRGPPRWRQRVLAILLLVGMVGLVSGVPLASRRVPRQEATVVLVIDVSGSMVADDVQPDRITAAKEAARDFVSSLPPKLTIGLVSFATDVELLEEPTADRDRVLEAIDGLSAGSGTAMEELSDVYDDIGSRVGYRKEATRWPLSTGIGSLAVTVVLSIAWRKKVR